MTRVKNKKKHRKVRYDRIIMSLLFLGGLIYFAVKLILGFFADQQLTYTVQVDSLNLEDSYTAFILRNELVVDTELTGKINYIAEESSIVKKNHPILEIYNDGGIVTSETISERELDRKKIQFDYTSLEYEIGALKDRIELNLLNKTYGEIPALKQELILKQTRLGKLRVENKFLSNRETSNVTQTIGSGHLTEGEKRTVSAPAEGILTYQIDGYESVLKADNIYNISFKELSDLKFEETSTRTEVSKSQVPLFKIVDVSTYYLLFEIAKEAIQTYEDIQDLEVHVDQKVLKAVVHDVYSDQDSAVVLIKLHEPFDDFHLYRWQDLKVVRQNYRGLKIKVSSIVTQEDRLGVYSVGPDRRVSFIPIKVLAYDSENAIVYNAQFYDPEFGLVRTISVDQEVVIDSKAFREGDIVHE
jgi:putative membrane fusion protein